MDRDVCYHFNPIGQPCAKCDQDEIKRLKKDLRHYMLAATAEAELVDELTKEKEADAVLLRQALEMMEESHYAVANQAPHDDVMAHFAVIEALRERLGEKT